MTLRRTAVLSVDEGVVASYVHAAIVAGPRQDRRHRRPEVVGRPRQAHRARPAGRHARRGGEPARRRRRAASTRQTVARERAIFAEQARESGKPEAIIEKMVEGRLRKFYEEAVASEAGLRHRQRAHGRDGAEGRGEGRRRRRSRSPSSSSSASARASQTRTEAADGIVTVSAVEAGRELRGRRRDLSAPLSYADSAAPLQRRKVRGSTMPPRPKPKRVLLKLSGEALLGNLALRHRRHGADPLRRRDRRRGPRRHGNRRRDRRRQHLPRRGDRGQGRRPGHRRPHGHAGDRHERAGARGGALAAKAWMRARSRRSRCPRSARPTCTGGPPGT